jgi:putative CocE/NonD family hydrolase
MTLASRIAARWLGLPPATNAVDCVRDLAVPMPDGVALLADRWVPRGVPSPPLLLVRSPYGRRRVFGFLYGRLFAERGFSVIVQSCRGTFGSGGDFVPNFRERADGAATIAWLREQPWFPGKVGLVGASYLGFVQWAIAREAPAELGALVVQIAPHEFRSVTYPGGSFALDTTLGWSEMVTHQERPLRMLLRMRTGERRMAAAAGALPLLESYRGVTGPRVAFFEDWLTRTEPADAKWWEPIDHGAALATLSAPVHLTGGWYDLFLPHTVAQYRALRDAGRAPRLLVGPWAHGDVGGRYGEFFGPALRFLRATLAGDGTLAEPPVRLFLTGAEEWREYEDYPPPGAREERFHLQPGGSLAPAAPAASEPDRYRYDPADPTPSVGGTTLGKAAGRKEQADLEARADVLVYTSAPCERDCDAIGPVRAELFVRSSLAHTDFFVRLCDVDPAGRSHNVCDGILRLVPGSPAADEHGVRRIAVALWPTAHRFLRGHRLRVQVSSGAHPRFARNPGSGEPLATATTLVAADQEVFHDPARPSALVVTAL